MSELYDSLQLYRRGTRIYRMRPMQRKAHKKETVDRIFGGFYYCRGLRLFLNGLMNLALRLVGGTI